MNSLISIVIPVYNGEEFIENCIKSILNQKYENLQIIVVDDGSKDQTLALVNKLKLEDSRIQVIHQKNGGVSKARNTGMQLIKGEWTLFVDADDTINENYCYNMLHAAEELNVEVLLAHPRMDKKQEYYTLNNIKKLQLACLSFDETSFDFNIDAPWGKMFKSEIISKHNVCFPENLTRSEDAYFCMNVYEHVSKVGVLNWFGYIHNEREGSLCRSYTENACLILDKVIKENEEWVLKNHPNDVDYYRALYYRVLPGIVECENSFFLHDDCNMTKISTAMLYQKNLSNGKIKDAIKNLKLSNISNKQYKIRTLFYKLKLGWLFILLKGK